MINDAPKGDKMQNCTMKIVEVDNKPHLCAFATRDISISEELRFDYGVPNLPWRKVLIIYVFIIVINGIIILKYMVNIAQMDT